LNIPGVLERAVEKKMKYIVSVESGSKSTQLVVIDVDRAVESLFASQNVYITRSCSRKGNEYWHQAVLKYRIDDGSRRMLFVGEKLSGCEDEKKILKESKIISQLSYIKKVNVERKQMEDAVKRFGSLSFDAVKSQRYEVSPQAYGQKYLVLSEGELPCNAARRRLLTLEKIMHLTEQESQA